MNKCLLLLVTILMLGSCNLEFVYDLNMGALHIKNKTLFEISGDNTNEIYSQITNRLGATNSSDPIYKLTIKSSKKEIAQIIDKDATASKFRIEYDISYVVFHLKQNCNILKIKIITESTYDAKSAGYSFGTDLSEKESIVSAIKKNVDRFASALNRHSDLGSCK